MEEEIAQIKMQHAKQNDTETEVETDNNSNDHEAEASNDQSLNNEHLPQSDGNEPMNESSIENGHEHANEDEQQEQTDSTTMDQTDQ